MGSPDILQNRKLLNKKGTVKGKRRSIWCKLSGDSGERPNRSGYLKVYKDMIIICYYTGCFWDGYKGLKGWQLRPFRTYYTEVFFYFIAYVQYYSNDVDASDFFLMGKENMNINIWIQKKENPSIFAKYVLNGL